MFSLARWDILLKVFYEAKKCAKFISASLPRPRWGTLPQLPSRLDTSSPFFAPRGACGVLFSAPARLDILCPWEHFLQVPVFNKCFLTVGT